ncbi:RbsD/FucU domain-containing protein [Caballeronia sp. NK8]
MPKDVDPLLTPDLLHALSSMGHGDEIAVVVTATRFACGESAILAAPP